jgi:hypothetical protein
MATRNSHHALKAAGHAIRRARERYGVHLGFEEYIRLCKRVAGGYGRLVGLMADGMEAWIIGHHEKRMLAVFDRELGRIRTFLPAGTVVTLVATPR